MATFIGYNTINQFRNFVLTDFDLIKRDLLNALNIRQGESPMRPLNGTSVWNFIFEPQSPEIIRAIETEIQRVVSRDPRIVLNSLVVYSQDNGVLVEMQVDTVAGAGVEDLIILFDQESQFATYV